MIERADTFRTHTHSRISQNPFSTRNVRPGVIPYHFCHGQSCDDLVNRLAELDWRAQIVGPHGSGKSTLLRSLVPHLERAGKTVCSFTLHAGQNKLPFDRTLISDGVRNSVVIIDGFEQLGWFARRKVISWCAQAGAGLIVTSHRSAGLPTLFQTAVSGETARLVVNLILAANGLPEMTANDLAALDKLVERHAGNLREVLFGLYDLYERHDRRSD